MDSDLHHDDDQHLNAPLLYSANPPLYTKYHEEIVKLGRTKTVYVWVSAALYAIVLIFIVVSQGDTGWGPFHPGEKSPHEGRLVFASIMQLLFFCWIICLNLELFYRANIDVNVVTGKKTVTELKPVVQSVRAAIIPSAASNYFFIGIFTYVAVFWYRSSDQHLAPAPPVVLQFAIWFGVIFLLVSPLPVRSAWKSRKLFYLRIMESFSCIFCYPVLNGNVDFIHVLITDGLTSATLMLWQLEYSICHFANVSWSDRLVSGSDGSIQSDSCGKGSRHFDIMKPFLYAVPFFLRFVQCLYLYGTKGGYMNLVNASKYVSALAVVFTSASLGWTSGETHDVMYGLWISALIVKSSFCYYWDIVQDWGLAQKGPHFPLREVRLYQNTKVYYIAIVTNLFGRVSWALAISPHFCHTSCGLLLGLVEISRRGQWNMFRVENQYIKNQKALDSKPSLNEPLINA